MSRRLGSKSPRNLCPWEFIVLRKAFESSLFLIPFLFVTLSHAADVHTFDGKYDISTIDLTVVYLVPNDRIPLLDWLERVEYYTKRITSFLARESAGKSNLVVTIHPKPLISGKSSETLRGKTPDETFFNSTNEAKQVLKWPNKRKAAGFPIILVLSEINWRELDDFTRMRILDGKPTHEGNVSANGRHFPGAESGGARAYYDANQGHGVGLVSADGWRVPYSGSDCVIFHEGLGHTIGLPHPEPADDSVMCFAQYNFWINQTWVTPTQKKALGWSDGTEKVPPDRLRTTDLFSAFTVLQKPITPQPGEQVSLTFTWPKDAKLRAIKIRVQTDIRGEWKTIPSSARGTPPDRLEIGAFDKATPVSYRVEAALEDGQTAEIWGYFQVKSRGSRDSG